MRKLLFVILPLMLSSQSFDSPDTYLRAVVLVIPVYLRHFHPVQSLEILGEAQRNPW